MDTTMDIHKPKSLVSHIHENNTTDEKHDTVGLPVIVDAISLAQGGGTHLNITKDPLPSVDGVKSLDKVRSDSPAENNDIAEDSRNETEIVDLGSVSNNERVGDNCDEPVTNAATLSDPFVEKVLESPEPISPGVADKGDTPLSSVLESVKEPTVTEESPSEEVLPSTDPPDIAMDGDSTLAAGENSAEVDDIEDAIDHSAINCKDNHKITDAIPDAKVEDIDLPADLPGVEGVDKVLDNFPEEKSNDDAPTKEKVSEKLTEEPEDSVDPSSKIPDQDRIIPADDSEAKRDTKEDVVDGDAEANVEKSSEASNVVGGMPSGSEGATSAAEPSKAVDVDETSVNEDELLKCSDQPDEESSMNLDEMAMNLDDTGDDDQEMEEFQHVKDKDLDISEDLHDVDTAADVDPIGLGDETDPKIVIADEPMDESIDDNSAIHDNGSPVHDVDKAGHDVDTSVNDVDKAVDAVETSGNDVGMTANDGDASVNDVDTSVNDVDKAVHEEEREIPGPEEVAMDTEDAVDADNVANSDVDPIGSSDNVDPIGSSDNVDPIGSSDNVDPIGSSDNVDPIDGVMETGEGTVAVAEAVAEAVDAEAAPSKAAVATTSTETDPADGEAVDGDDPSSAKPAAAVPEDNDDEEICIIPDTIRIPPPGTVIPDKPPPGEAGAAEAKAKDVSIVASVVNTQKAKAATPVAAAAVRPQRQAAKRAESQIKELAREDSNSGDGLQTNSYKSDDIVTVEPSMQNCVQCSRSTMCRYQLYVAGQRRHLCSDECTKLYQPDRSPTPSGVAESVPGIPEDFSRKCGQCSTKILGEEKNLAWETMDFCNEECLGKYQLLLGSFCANCKGAVASPSLGKYCVRFGYDIKQFCCSGCLEEFKKGLKVCSYCQKDISNDNDGFLAPVGNKGIFKDFCTQGCMEKYDYMGSSQPAPPELAHCAVCKVEKVVQVELLVGAKLHKLCSDPCFAAFKFVNDLAAGTCKCEMCKQHFDKMRPEKFSIFADEAVHDFCTKTCMNVYILANRKIVPCHWCKVKKYNFDMIKRVSGAGQVTMMCSLNCLTLYQVSVNAVSSKKIKCDFCRAINQAQYHLTMSDATIRNFCMYECVMKFQSQYSKAPPLTLPPGADKPVIPTGPIVPNGSKHIPNTYARRAQPPAQTDTQPPSTMPVISSVTSLAPNGQQQAAQAAGRTAAHKSNNVGAQQQQQPPPAKPPQVVYKQQVIVKPATPKDMRNKSVACKVMMVSKGSSCRPTTSNKESQTDDNIGRPIFIPVPVPIFVPAPMHMFSVPFPMPVPFPLPIPVPMFIPTTRNSIAGIMKEMKRIQEKIPADPFEAELLMMAEMVADDKKANSSDSDSDDGGDNGAQDISEVPEAGSATEGGFSPEAVDTSNFGEDMLQMALKMASELDEPAVDLEAALTPSTISAPPSAVLEHNDVTESEMDDSEPVDRGATRGRKRGMPAQRRGSMGTPSKRGRRISSSGGGGDAPLLPPPEPATTPRVEVEKPDANMCLKYTFGVNAWRQWVNAKNAELEKANSARKPLKLFKPEILQLTSDELNYSLCLFVKEVRKPNGTEYAPDTIYYLVLGIQQYLFENGRIDNIFTDAYYEKFTECLDEVAKNFSLLFNEQQYIVTRVEEEHLWESKQLGAHSPHVLLSTLMFFNTKHFNLTTVEEHMQLSFSHIMKHWKRNPNQPGATKVPGSRNVLLRFYPPQATLEANSRKKKVYEQQENEENPLRCPVKLYEFYLSKCPESVKTRNDVFYLLPERSCVPDSPVWYSTMALGKDPLIKMLHRVKMVKEINMALLTS